MVDVPQSPITGLAFFPGGSGLWTEKRTAALWTCPSGLCIVLGQDFGLLSDFNLSFDAGEEARTVATWGNLCKMIDAAGIDPKGCFFTNAIMGLREAGRNTGPSPALKHPAFRSACTSFLEAQIEQVRPRAIVTLGWEPLGLLADLSQEARVASKCGSFAELDRRDLSLQRASMGKKGLTFMLGALMHPTAYAHQVKSRRFAGKEGIHAQAEILHRCWLASPTS